jgi:hypothetical protein
MCCPPGDYLCLAEQSCGVDFVVLVRLDSSSHEPTASSCLYPALRSVTASKQIFDAIQDRGGLFLWDEVRVVLR